MEELANYLRSEREKKGLSLREVQEITKIRLRYLEAIEAGQFDIIPGEVYVKGFLRNYAEAIGLDGSEVVKMYKQLRLEKEAEEREAGRKEDAGGQQQGEGRLRKRFFIAGILVVLVIVAAGIYSVFIDLTPSDQMGGIPGERWSGPASVENGTEVDTPGAVDLHDDKMSLVLKMPDYTDKREEMLPGIIVKGYSEYMQGLSEAGVEATEENTIRILIDEKSTGITGSGVGKAAGGVIQIGLRGKKGPSEPGSEEKKPLQVEVYIEERCWFEVKSDGRIVFSGILEKGETALWQAEKRLRVRMGHAEGVLFTVNGKEIGKIGTGVMTYVFEADDLTGDL